MRLKNSCNSFLPRNDYGLAIRWGSQKTGVAKNRGRKTTFFSKDSIANIAILWYPLSSPPFFILPHRPEDYLQSFVFYGKGFRYLLLPSPPRNKGAVV